MQAGKMIYSILSVTLYLAITVIGQPTEIRVSPTLPSIVNSGVTIPKSYKNSSICYKYVGCFNNYPPFDNAGGGVLPSPPEHVGTMFLLYTNENNLVAQQLDYKDKGKSLKQSNFNPLFPTKFIIHGFTQDEREIWLHTMKDALLTTGPLNVVIVGWGEGASAPDYPRAVANTRIVAKQIQLLIGLMSKQGMQLSRIHLIGHSLGAHVSGYVGDALNGQLGRISGMDPAGPLYEGYDEKVRLNPSDAIFVDVIHSNAKPMIDGGAGMFASCGHVDFYPNGGKDQPGCPGLGNTLWNNIVHLDFKGLGRDAACSHGRSHELYIESIPNGNHCPLKSVPCSSLEDYEAGKCKDCGEDGCTELGYHSIEYAARGKFYLRTKGSKTAEAEDGDQFCGMIYEITISPNSGQKDIKGAIDLNISGSKSSVDTHFQGSDTTLSGDTKVIVVDYVELGDLKSIDLKYKRNEGGFLFGWGSGVKSWKVHHVDISHEGKVAKFCPDSSSQVNTGSMITLKRC